MNEKYKIIKKEELVPVKWAGGDISNLFIYPADSIYEKKDFLFTLSTANVEQDVSDFTGFVNYNRIIMTLDNELKLVDNNDKSIVLTKNIPYLFDGADDTVSYANGKLTDFNIIFRKDHCFVDTNSLSIQKDSTIYPRKTFFNYDNVYEFIYCTKGDLKFMIGNTEHNINSGDFLVIDHKFIDRIYSFVNINDQVCNVNISMVMFNNATL